MTAVDAATARAGIGSRAVVVLAAVVAAVAINLLVFAVGRLAGGDFAFTQAGSTAHVDVVTVAGFSAVPLGLGLIVVALLARRLFWIARVAIVVAPVLAVATIVLVWARASPSAPTRSGIPRGTAGAPDNAVRTAPVTADGHMSSVTALRKKKHLIPA